MRETKQISILSDFLRNKIKSNGLTKRKFAEKTGLNETYSYKLLSALRHFIPNDETLMKIADVLELSSEERNYILDIVKHEREIRAKIYSTESVNETSVLKPLDIILPDKAGPVLENSLSDNYISEVKPVICEIDMAEEKEKIEVCLLNEILIPKDFLDTPPAEDKIQEIISYFYKHGRLDKPIKVVRQIILTDGYKHYLAAKELGLKEIKVEFLDSSILGIINPFLEKKKKDISVKKKNKSVNVLTGKRIKGRIKKLFPGKGYGFINGDDGEVYFFHQSGLKGLDIADLDIEYRVTFEFKEGLKGHQAINIKEDLNF